MLIRANRILRIAERRRSNESDANSAAGPRARARGGPGRASRAGARVGRVGRQESESCDSSGKVAAGNREAGSGRAGQASTLIRAN